MYQSTVPTVEQRITGCSHLTPKIMCPRLVICSGYSALNYILALTFCTLSTPSQRQHRHHPDHNQAPHKRPHRRRSTRLPTFRWLRRLALRLTRSDSRSTHPRTILALLIIQDLRVLAERNVHALYSSALSFFASSPWLPASPLPSNDKNLHYKARSPSARSE